MLEYRLYQLGGFPHTVTTEESSTFCEASISTLSGNMSGEPKTDVNTIQRLAGDVEKLKLAASSTNVTVGGVSYSTDVMQIHSLIRAHKLIYSPDDSPSGKWTWDGMREIKKKGEQTNPNFILADGISTFYGNMNYSYSVKEGEDIKNIVHDVMSVSPVILDAKARKPPKSKDSGVYGVDWWNIYLSTALLKKVAEDVQNTTNYVVSDEGMISDAAQGLVSVTVNVRDDKDSPNITLITVDEDDDDDETGSGGSLIYTDLGTLKSVMLKGGEEELIGGIGFFSVGLSCKGPSGQQPPPAGTTVKLSLKMKAFHALHLIDSGIRRISYQSPSSGLKY